MQQNGEKYFYLYNSSDMRIYKENQTESLQEFTLIDATGILGVKQMSTDRWELYAGRGNIRLSLTADMAGNHLQSALDNDPYGHLIRQYTATQPERFLTTGNERDQETQLDYRQARFYSSVTGRFLSVDPKWDAAPGWTPFRYGYDNPIKFNDHNGRLESPIYGRYGNFLGTDSKGLQGKGIVMRKKDFVQGMSHSLAKKNNLGKKGFLTSNAVIRFVNHYKKLEDRPDYNGFLTFSQIVEWAKERPNTFDNNDPNDAVYINAAKLDFGSLKTTDLKLGKSKMQYLYDFTNYWSYRSRVSTYLLGHTAITLIDAKTGEVTLQGDILDWDYHNSKNVKYPWDLKGERDKLVYSDRIIKGTDDSHKYQIYIYGVGKLNKD